MVFAMNPKAGGVNWSSQAICMHYTVSHATGIIEKAQCGVSRGVYHVLSHCLHTGLLAAVCIHSIAVHLHSHVQFTQKQQHLQM